MTRPWKECPECNSSNCCREISPGLGRGSWQVSWRTVWTLPTATISTASGTPTDRPLSVGKKSKQTGAESSYPQHHWLSTSTYRLDDGPTSHGGSLLHLQQGEGARREREGESARSSGAGQPTAANLHAAAAAGRWEVSRRLGPHQLWHEVCSETSQNINVVPFLKLSKHVYFTPVSVIKYYCFIANLLLAHQPGRCVQ